MQTADHKVVQTLPSDAGLTSVEASSRLKIYGKNNLPLKKGNSLLQLFFKQFKNLLVVLLLAAAATSFYLGSFRDGMVLFFIVLVNALIGFYQEWKSENILNSIKTLVVEKCLVIRDHTVCEIPVELLVPGDLVVLSEGDGVPADLRLTESTSLAANEFILTGESFPKDKTTDSLFNPATTDNSLFMGTTVVRGHAKGIVCATGTNTELGKIARHSIEIRPEDSPLQKEVNTLAYKITFVTLLLAAVLFIVKLLLHENFTTSLIFAVGVAAAMVPEGLPAQISIALSFGVRKLAQKNAIVKQLSSVEALGAATVIATDKTGTITCNEMTIEFCHFAGYNYKVSGIGFEPKGEILNLEKDNQSENMHHYFPYGYLASTSGIHPPDEFHRNWYPLGDPTESAFATLSMKAGFVPDKLDRLYSTVKIYPFDSERKCMTVLRSFENSWFCFSKGSIESILKNSSFINDKDCIREISAEDISNILSLAKAYALNGLRIIAIAYKNVHPTPEEYLLSDAECNLIFLGFACMIDPPHESVKETIHTAFEAKIRVMMITGDNEITAAAIAEKIGLTNPDGTDPLIFNQGQLNTLTDEELQKQLHYRTLIFSRVSPDQKLRIVTLLKERGDVVAVTGDGVNDALSLKKSDIGIAMGEKGSKIAQEASDMILLDDNFSTIVTAIREGRTIFSNIQKNVVATLATNFTELACVLAGFAGTFLGYPEVILPIQILLIDLVGEMPTLLALSADPSNKSIMTEAPRKKGNLLNKESISKIAVAGLLRSSIALWTFFSVYTNEPANHTLAMSCVLASIILSQFVNIFSLRSAKSVFSGDTFTNRFLMTGMFISFALTLLMLYLPVLNEFLHTAPPGISEWYYILRGVILYVMITETVKRIKKT